MKSIKKLFFIAGFLYSFLSVSQTVTGVVKSNSGELLIGANVYWMNTSVGAVTNQSGVYSLEQVDNGNALIASFVGFATDTISWSGQTKVDFTLTEETLETIELTTKRKGLTISNIDPIKTENISKVELNKFACCDLAGGFNTQLTVESKTTNIITNSKELRILGLAGVYNQVLFDGFPVMRGLGQTYGVSSFSGNLLDNIFVAKGANSVIQGYESISGQINVVTKKPNDSEKFLLNLYANSFAEKHLNTNYTFSGKKWKNLVAFSTVQPANKFDKDKDTFLDVPILNRYMLMNTFQYGKKKNYGWFSTTTFRLLDERRVGGQVDYDRDADKGSSTVYGQHVHYTQPEFWSKNIYRFNDDQSISIYAAGMYQNQESYFGTVKYDATQTYLYGKVQYKQFYGDKGSNFRTGISYRFLDLEENVLFTENSLNRTYDGNYRNKENVFGVFAENSLKLLENLFTLNTGIRADHHNKHGLMVTPRALLKYDINEHASVRTSLGFGWRTANVFSENVKLFASSRDIIFTEDLKPEEAVNFGVNYTHKFEISDVSGYISADYYRTSFQNQIFPDYDRNSQSAYIENFEDKSISAGIQAEVSLTFKENFDLKLGYNYSDVYREVDGNKQDLPFNRRNRVSISTSYRTMKDKLHFDVNLHWNDKTRLPDRSDNPLEYQTPLLSNAYVLVNGQIAYYLPKYKFYVGVENMMNYRQDKPILSWQDPFSPYFDTSSVWGPTRGREFYIGFTYTLK